MTPPVTGELFTTILRESVDPYTALEWHGARLLTEVARSSLRRRDAVLLGRIAVALRWDEAVRTALPSLTDPLPPADLLLRAQLHRLVGAQDAAIIDLRTVSDAFGPQVRSGFAWRFAGEVLRHAPPFRDDLLDRLRSTVAGDRYPFELLLGRPLPDVRRAGLAAHLAERADIEPSRARERLEVGLALEPTSVRRFPLPWSDPTGFEPAWLADLEARIHRSLDAREGLSIVRLGDGEGRFLVGDHPGLQGLNGIDESGRPRPVDAVTRARLADDLVAAVRTSDVVGAPDLADALVGHPRSSATFEAHRIHGLGERLVAGANELHFGLEASGALQRLLPRVTGIITRHDRPTLLPLATSEVEVLRLPAHTSSRLRTAPRGSHLEDHFARVRAHPFRPGELWLVAAGILGKIYCADIRAAGAVALDIGAVADLWANDVGTRGEMKMNLWLAHPYRTGPAGASARVGRD